MRSKILALVVLAALIGSLLVPASSAAEGRADETKSETDYTRLTYFVSTDRAVLEFTENGYKYSLFHNRRENSTELYFRVIGEQNLYWGLQLEETVEDVSEEALHEHAMALSKREDAVLRDVRNEVITEKSDTPAPTVRDLMLQSAVKNSQMISRALKMRTNYWLNQDMAVLEFVEEGMRYSFFYHRKAEAVELYFREFDEPYLYREILLTGKIEDLSAESLKGYVLELVRANPAAERDSRDRSTFIPAEENRGGSDYIPAVKQKVEEVWGSEYTGQANRAKSAHGLVFYQREDKLTGVTLSGTHFVSTTMTVQDFITNILGVVWTNTLDIAVRAVNNQSSTINAGTTIYSYSCVSQRERYINIGINGVYRYVTTDQYIFTLGFYSLNTGAASAEQGSSNVVHYPSMNYYYDFNTQVEDAWTQYQYWGNLG